MASVRRVEIGLIGVIVAVTRRVPRVLVLRATDALPFGPFDPDADRSLELGLRRWVRTLYQFAPVPTQAFYFRVPLDIALRRMLSARAKLKHYEAGLDLALHADPSESYKLFQSRLLTEYETIVQEHGITVMDATLSVEAQQRRLRGAIRGSLPPLRRGGRPHA